MEKTTLYLPGELQVALRQAAKRAGKPQAELVREALTRYLADQPRPLPKSIGSAADGTLDATEVDQWLEREFDRDYARHVGDAGPSRQQGAAPRRGKGRPAR